MRDQWRAKDDDRDDRHRRERRYSDRRRPSPAGSTRQGGADFGVKIKGRATADRGARPTFTGEDVEEHRSSRRQFGRKLSHSPGRGHNGEVQTKHTGKLSTRSITSRQAYNRDIKPSDKRKRSRSRSSHRNVFRHREERRRSRSPVPSDRHSRAGSLSGRRHKRDYSPPVSPRRDHLSFREDIPAFSERHTRDPYVSSTQRPRPRSPVLERSQNPSHIRRRSRSPGKRPKPRKRPPPLLTKEISPGDRASRRYRQTTPSTYHRNSRSRDTSPQQNLGARHQRRHSSCSSHSEPRPSYRKRRPSRIHVASESASDKSKKMQSSTQPIQSILDESPRQPSPPRPIPSFDSDSHDSGAVRDAFPLHGMKANEVHGHIRPGRPHVDTRQSYSTSPQWTPTSSHHGSPQSGSPFNHGRGGWSGQSQHFHGQTR